MKLKEHKNISMIVINKVAEIAQDCDSVEELHEASSYYLKRFNGYYWSYRGGSHVALMELNPLTGESDRIAMYA